MARDPHPLRTCLRCGASWRSRTPRRPDSCPRCHNRYWDRPYERPDLVAAGRGKETEDRELVAELEAGAPDRWKQWAADQRAGIDPRARGDLPATVERARARAQDGELAAVAAAQ